MCIRDRWHTVRARAVRTYVLELVHIVGEMTSALITSICCTVTRWRTAMSTSRTSRTAWIHHDIQSTILIRRHASHACLTCYVITYLVHSYDARQADAVTSLASSLQWENTVHWEDNAQRYLYWAVIYCSVRRASLYDYNYAVCQLCHMLVSQICLKCRTIHSCNADCSHCPWMLFTLRHSSFTRLCVHAIKCVCVHTIR